MSDIFKRTGLLTRKTLAKFKLLYLFGLLGALLLGPALSQSAFGMEYTVEQAIAKALANDPWIKQSYYRQKSLDALSVESGSLPDPAISLSMANLPTDTFDFNQEPMTQFKVGVSQKFSRGKTLVFQRERLENLGQMQPKVREDRNAQVAVLVTKLWFEAYRGEVAINLIEKDRHLFTYLVGVARLNYTSTSRGVRQQDIVRAKLELTRLDDRLTQLKQYKEDNLARLGEWLDDPNVQLAYDSEDSLLSITNTIDLNAISASKLNEIVSNHPLVQSIDWKVKAYSSDIEVAKQSYKPQWGISASYAYRDTNNRVQERPDLFSLGVTFDVPLYKAKRQDKKLQSAQAEYEAVKTERTLALRQLRAGYQSATASYARLLERRRLFDNRLLREMEEQAVASLAAYTNDDGDFAEVVRARIAELNARVEALNVHVEIQKNTADLNYYLVAETLKNQSRIPSSVDLNQGGSYE